MISTPQRRVKFLDLNANCSQIKDSVLEHISHVIETTSFINGPSVQNFEKQFAIYIGTKYCVGVGNGTDALEIALAALGIGKGDEVITQANTFISTCFAITSCGATPVLVDHINDDFMIDVDQIESKITSKTKCIIPVHLYGHCADMERIMDIAKRHNLWVVEDAAQAHGALYRGKRAGSFGDISCFSFYPGKNLGAYGDGGAVLTSNDVLHEKINKIHNLGSDTKYHHEMIGRNSRLDSIQAEVLSIKLLQLDANNEKRLHHARQYDLCLKGVGDIQLHTIREDVSPAYHLYVIRTSKRDELQIFLKKHDIETGIHYPIPIHKSGAYSHMNTGTYLNTEQNADKLLSLPMYPELDSTVIKHVCSVIIEYYNQ